MPPTSYILEGTARVNSLIKGSSEREHTINTNNAGAQDLDLYVGGGTTTEITTVYIKNLTTAQEITVTTNSSGVWNYDLANMSEGYSNDDILLIRISTFITNDPDEFVEPRTRDTNTYNEQAKANKVINVDSFGNEVTRANPLPVLMKNERLDYDNTSKVFTNNAIGAPTQIDATVEGVTYRKTFTYNGFGAVLTETAWTEV